MTSTASRQIRRELVRAADRQSGHESTPAWSLVGRLRRLSPPAVAMAVGAFAAVAVAATAVWQPLVGDEGRGHPTVSAARAPSSQRELFAVLQRPQSAVDRSALSRYALRLQDPTLSGVRVGDVRVLRPGGAGHGYVLFSAEQLTPPASDPPPSIPGAAPYVPPATKHEVLCVFARDGDGGGQSCNTTDELRQGLGVSILGQTVYGLVPDGVARVTLRLADGAVRSADVHDNFFAIRVQGLPSLHADWFDQAGRRIGPASPADR